MSQRGRFLSAHESPLGLLNTLVSTVTVFRRHLLILFSMWTRTAAWGRLVVWVFCGTALTGRDHRYVESRLGLRLWSQRGLAFGFGPMTLKPFCRLWLAGEVIFSKWSDRKS